ncbi:hypothetical protein C5688_08665 [Methylocystis sp. MitZ-2018]|nr:hypothetical protein C5688_08665 [Methylocystis sp. MitZ-2018]
MAIMRLQYLPRIVLKKLEKFFTRILCIIHLHYPSFCRPQMKLIFSGLRLFTLKMGIFIFVRLRSEFGTARRT